MPDSQTFSVELTNGHTVHCRFLDDEGTAWWMKRLEDRPDVSVEAIGKSRGERQLYGLRIGHGPIKVSITAGAHADEPAGPMAACALAWFLSDTDCAPLRDKFSFTICPQVNPDGAEANKVWFAPTPDLETYLRQVQREGPGDDIEFGYPGDSKPALRPENQAVADYLTAHGPYHIHASLHSMGTAEGAWFLIEKSWADRTQPLQRRLAELASRYGLGLHDIQRNGEKGFTRIDRGFCTTPTSTAMRDYFLKLNDPDTAARFHFSSMEFVKSLGGNPLSLVTEIPNFTLGWTQTAGNKGLKVDSPPPEPRETLYERCRDQVKKAMATGDTAGAVKAAADAGAVPVPFATHVALQVEAVLAACEFIRASDLPEIVQGVLSDDSSGRSANQ